eukprot:1100703-Amphidinium_carterae.1
MCIRDSLSIDTRRYYDCLSKTRLKRETSRSSFIGSAVCYELLFVQLGLETCLCQVYHGQGLAGCTPSSYTSANGRERCQLEVSRKCSLCCRSGELQPDGKASIVVLPMPRSGDVDLNEIPISACSSALPVESNSHAN